MVRKPTTHLGQGCLSRALGIDMVSIQKGLPPELVGSASELFLSALAEKLVPILGDDSRAAEFIKSSIVVSSCFSALEDNKLLGILAIQTENHNFLNPSFKNLSAHYGFWRAITKGVALQLLQHKPKPKELYVEGIAVFDFAQGKGVGTKLIEELMSFARTQGFKNITLEVIDTNQRALQLYERLGFSIQKRSKIWPVNKIIGWPFNETILMEQTIG